MRKYIILTLLFQFSLIAASQELYTDYLQKKTPKRGIVVLHQSKAITDLVNGLSRPSTPTGRIPLQHSAEEKAHAYVISTGDSTSLIGNSLHSGQRVRVNGYRIQIFSGGNSRAAKTEANMNGQLVKSLFPELSVYTQFISPHWKCRVGDFRTFEEANSVFMKLKETQRFREAVIVKSKINVYYY